MQEHRAIEASCLALIQTWQDVEYSSAALYVWGMTLLAHADYLYGVSASEPAPGATAAYASSRVPAAGPVAQP